MRRFLKAAAMAGIAGVLGVTLALVPLAFGPAQVAQAFACYPPSTVNPACQPANLPIILEASGVAAAPTATGTVGVATGGTAQLAANGVAGLGLLGVFAGFNLGGVVGETKGVMSMIGLKDQHIKTDPSYTPPVPTGSGCSILGRPIGLASPLLPPSWTATGAVSNPGSPGTCATTGTTALDMSSGAARNYGLVSSTGTGVGNTVVISVPASPFYIGTEGIMGMTAYCKSPTTGSIFHQWRIASTSGWNQNSPTPTSLKELGAVGSNYRLQLTCGPTMELAWIGVSHRYNPGVNPALYLGMVLWNARTPTVAPPGPELKGELSTRVDCLTSTGEIRTVTGLAFVEVLPGTPIEIPDTLCPPDEIAVGTEIGWKPSTGTEVVPVIPRTEPPQEIKELPQQFPDCFPPDGSRPCALTLWQAKPGQALESCGAAGELCDGWAQQPNAHQLYNCRYGPYPVDLNKCSAYRFPRLGILPNMGLDGSPIPITAPAPSPLPNPVNNPSTGLPAQPGTDPNAGADGKQDCWPTGWGVLNPASWVLMPMKCAIDWAFKPNPQVVTARINAVRNAWGASQPGAIIGEFAAMEFEPVDGCSGISVDMSWLNVGGYSMPVMQLLPACPGDFFEQMAGYSKIVTYIAATVGGLYALTRHIGRTFGYSGLGND